MIYNIITALLQKSGIKRAIITGQSEEVLQRQQGNLNLLTA